MQLQGATLGTSLTRELTIIYRDSIWLRSYFEEGPLPSFESRGPPPRESGERRLRGKNRSICARAASINPYKLTKSGYIGWRDLVVIYSVEAFPLPPCRNKRNSSRCTLLGRNARERERELHPCESACSVNVHTYAST